MKNQVTSFEYCKTNIIDMKIFLNFRIKDRILSENFIPNFDLNFTKMFEKINEAIKPLLQDFDKYVAKQESFGEIIKLI
jgi:hypothetical protein